MEVALNCTDTLKTVLKNIRSPGQLDDHPWTQSLIVQERLARDPRARQAGPGQQLVHAIAGLFQEMLPATPPRRGKRLDPRWGEFGLLAALYFAPFGQGTPFPGSLLEAWRRIDPAILYHVYGKPAALLSREEIERYRLVGEEADFGSASTLSDWHRKGVQRLAEILANRERYLSESPSAPPTPVKQSKPRLTRRYRRPLWTVLALVVVTLLLLGGLRARDVYLSGRAVLAEAAALQRAAAAAAQTGDLQAAYPLMIRMKSDLSALHRQAGPLLWLGPRLDWVPTYGGDLAAAPALLDLAGHLLEAGDLGYRASRPLLEQLGTPGSSMDPAGLTALLVQAQPGLARARQELDGAIAARERIDASRLSPRLGALLVERLDPVLERADTGLSLATSLPVLLGASGEGPKTYLLLVQNEDELRATGGFITTVGRLVVHDGQVISLDFEQVDNQEDWNKPYPAAPWQMQEYMNIPVMLLRDANWSPDFHTSAEMAETLYAYNHSTSADGVIAFDQHFLVMLLGRLGPLPVEGASGPVTAENVIGYMREAKKRPEGQDVPAGWYRKEFIPRISAALLTRLVGGESHDWRAIASTLTQALQEKHLLLQVDNPQVSALLGRQGWDNALRAGSGDLLMVTDTNMGFNKTDAVVERRLSYSVDLRDLAAPSAGLVVSHTNHADPKVPCIHWNDGQLTEETTYPIDRCYWSYLRVYKPAGTELLAANPQAVPGEWMDLGQEVPARVDRLDEDLPGIGGYGTFLVVPGGETAETQMRFTLPQGIVQGDEASGQVRYHLEVRKQPGTLAVPLQIRVRLPAGAQVQSAPPGAEISGSEVSLETSLQTDVDFDLVWIPH